jgi:hypothetical protein
MPKEYWRPFQQPVPSSGYTLGNAQIEVETRWAHFPACLQPILRPNAHCVSAYIRRVVLISVKLGSFIKLNTNQRHNTKNLIIISGGSSIFSLSNHTNFA